jgi:hypothetical protein
VHRSPDTPSAQSHDLCAAFRVTLLQNDVEEFIRAGGVGIHRSEDVVRTIMVYTGATMAMAKRAHTKSAHAKHVRRSVTLPAKVARQVEALARQRDLSDNRVLVELIEQGIEAQQQKEKAFFQLAERFRAASDPEQVKQLGDQLGRFVFGA